MTDPLDWCPARRTQKTRPSSDALWSAAYELRKVVRELRQRAVSMEDREGYEKSLSAHWHYECDRIEDVIAWLGHQRELENTSFDRAQLRKDRIFLKKIREINERSRTGSR
jgi:hypothetical protein